VLAPGRDVYLVPASGPVTVTLGSIPGSSPGTRAGGVAVGARDGAAIAGEADLAITATSDGELVLVDVAA
jgi:hypothetical protein